MLENDEIDNQKQRLWDNINRENAVDVKNNAGLQRLLTFIEMPSFIKEPTNKSFLPDISFGNSLLNQTKKVPRDKRPSFLLNNKEQFGSSNRLPVKDMMDIMDQVENMKIDEEKGCIPISAELAALLRQYLLGNLKHKFSSDWLGNSGAYFNFKCELGGLPYSLFGEKACTRSFVAVIQAFLMKNFLFQMDISNETRHRLLNVSVGKRTEVLIRTLAELLWKLGEYRNSVVCLLGNESYIDASPFYSCDGITEKIQLFKFKSLDVLTNFIRKRIIFFTNRKYPGFLLFLYSAILSKGIKELFEDFQYDNTKCLFTPGSDSLNQFAINLLLTGYATEYLHNGALMYDKMTGELLPRPQYGIKSRSRIGYLQYTSVADREYLFNSRSLRRASEGGAGIDVDQINTVGSRLKTPVLPIWVINANGNYGVLFCLKDDLTNHWRAENTFKLYYLNCSISQTEPCILTIVTRRGRTAKFKTALVLREENKRTPLLNHVINTKWYGCRIEWDGKTPFI